MKKILAVILCFAVLAAFCGCNGSEPKDPTLSTPTDPPTVTDPTDPGNTAALPSMIAVTLTPISEEFRSEDGTTIAYYTYPQLGITGADSNIASLISADLLNRIEKNRATANDLQKKAEQKYDPDLIWEAYSLTVDYFPTRLDNLVLSFSGEIIATEGDVTVSETFANINYHAVTGKILLLGDIVKDSTAAEKLCDRILMDLQGMHEDLNSNYSSTVLSRFSAQSGDSWAEEDAWFLTESTLNICFGSGSIADASMGAVIVEIPYTELQGILREEYLTNSVGDGNGTLVIKPLKEIDVNAFDRSFRLELDSDGHVIAITASETIYNLRVEQGFLSYDSTAFWVTSTPLFCSSLSANELIRLKVYLPEFEPVICLSYTIADEERTCYLMADENGDLLVMDELPTA